MGNWKVRAFENIVAFSGFVASSFSIYGDNDKKDANASSASDSNTAISKSISRNERKIAKRKSYQDKMNSKKKREMYYQITMMVIWLVMLLKQ